MSWRRASLKDIGVNLWLVGGGLESTTVDWLYMDAFSLIPNVGSL